MTFKLNKKEEKTYNEFVKEQYAKDKMSGNLTSITFTLTGIGSVKIVKRGKVKKDITDCDCW